jgi:hypothetical protein
MRNRSGIKKLYGPNGIHYSLLTSNAYALGGSEIDAEV